MSQFKEHLVRAHAAWRAHLHPGDGAIDMTCGNGYDTLALAELLPNGWVIALDVQLQAVEATRRRIAPHAERVCVIQTSHSQLDALPLPTGQRPRLIVYNLGYLPGSDKTHTTRAETTVESLQQALKLLAPDGALSIMCYPGHDEGLREEQAVLAWARGLPRENEVVFHQWLNRNRAPSWLWISNLTKASFCGRRF